ncbi:MAG: flavodoxin family protein [Christensenellaceae bacterium]|jgi:putative NADPH-quinone reductase
MGKKILVITGSYRKNGNSDRMADAFIKGAEQNGHTAVKFEAAHKTIQGCRACDRCWSTGEACCVNDDFRELARLLESSDVLVLAAPLYWFSFPAPVKAAIDKLYAYGGAGGLRPLGIKESVLLLCGEGPDNGAYDGAVEMYKGSFGFLGIEDRGVVVTGGVGGAGDIEKTDGLKKAEQLGSKI